MKLKLFLLLAAILLLASPIWAADAANNPAPTNWKPVGAAIGMAIASGLCGLGQGRAVAGATEAMARNPGALNGIRGALILGLVLIESLALYTLVIIYTI
ncbi:MAG TPA: ATP synthase F0 subunit C [Bryobacteraceae bacterium]|nr:ATP synthase F0 subunit C [Bryobacteraceae bacterium]